MRGCVSAYAAGAAHQRSPAASCSCVPSPSPLPSPAPVPAPIHLTQALQPPAPIHGHGPWRVMAPNPFATAGTTGPPQCPDAPLRPSHRPRCSTHTRQPHPPDPPNHECNPPIHAHLPNSTGALEATASAAVVAASGAQGDRPAPVPAAAAATATPTAAARAAEPCTARSAAPECTARRWARHLAAAWVTATRRRLAATGLAAATRTAMLTRRGCSTRGFWGFPAPTPGAFAWLCVCVVVRVRGCQRVHGLGVCVVVRKITGHGSVRPSSVNGLGE